MTLAAGTRLGPYEILAPLGAGGMGEVYRARDTQLSREVAIKRVAGALANDPEHRARFEREARLLASLNHPNIAAIYGIEEREGIRFLVLELVEGEPLDELLAAGPLPLTDALDLTRQVADALAAAHEKGVIHRDLKPSNVRVTPAGRAKVLDFGLAFQRPLDAAGREQTAAAQDPLVRNNLTALPTLARSQGLTREGTILGTPAYMSPEQARGRSLDRRTDIWAFGCLLYETLTGRRAFDGETTSDCLVAILEREPDWAKLPPRTPPSVARLLQRCLEKDAERRQRDAGDARLEIETALSELRPKLSQGARAVGSRESRRMDTLFRAIPSLFSRAAHRTDSGADRPQPRLSQVTFADALEGFPAFSEDASQLAFSREIGAVRKIFVKELRTGEERALTAGDADDLQAAWSHDGQTVVFARARDPGRKVEPVDVFGQYEGTDLWSIDTATGRETLLVENASNPTFSPTGRRLAFDASWAGPRRIWMTDERGRNPQQATSDTSEAIVHVRPRWSPDGQGIVFQNIERTKFDIRVVELPSKRLLWVTNDHFQDFCPVWSPSGRFVFFSSYRSGGLNIWRVPVSADGAPAGPPQPLTSGPGQDVEATVSRDGKRLAFSILKQNAHIWRLPISPGASRPAGAPEKVIATTREDSRGFWSRDGRSIAFNSNRTGDMNIWLHSLEDGTARPLTRGPGGDYQPRFSPDGRRIAFFSTRSGSVDIWTVDLAGGKLRRLTHGASIDVNPAYSPGGEKLAFMSDRGGRLEVWIMDSNGGASRPLTDVGVMGHFLLWSADGKSIFFRCPAGKPRTMRVSVFGGAPEPLPEVAGGSHMSFSPDQAFIMDVVGHKTLWISPLHSGKPEPVFEFDDPDARIDYPVWSPDGKWILFDRFRPQGGDIWLMEGFE